MKWSERGGAILGTRRLRAFAVLEGHEQRVVVEAVWLWPIAAVALRAGGLRGCRRVLGRWVVMDQPSAIAAPQAARLGQLVAAATRFGSLRSSCLTRSLVLWAVLGHRGLAAEIRLGVRRTRDGPCAHAWVEHEGAVIEDAEAASYRRLDPVGSGSRSTAAPGLSA